MVVIIKNKNLRSFVILIFFLPSTSATDVDDSVSGVEVLASSTTIEGIAVEASDSTIGLAVMKNLQLKNIIMISAI